MATSTDFKVKNGLVVSTTATILGDYESTSSQTGALIVVGGVGISGNLYVGGTINGSVTGSSGIANTATNLEGGLQYQIPYQLSPGQTGFEEGFEYNYDTDILYVKNINITSSTVSISTTTGALVVEGGVGIGGDLYVNGPAYVQNSEVITSATIFNYATNTLIEAGTDTAVSTSTGIVTIWNTSTLQSVTDRGSVTTNAININNNTVSISTTTGALVVDGGVGIGGDLYVNGEIVAQKLTIELTTVTTTTVETDDIIKTYNTTNSISTTTGALIISGGAGIGKNLYIGGSSVFNSDGGNFDTQIKGLSDQNLLFVDASVDRIGIGTNVPTGKVDINRTTQANTLTHSGYTLEISTVVSDGIETLTGNKTNYGLFAGLTNNAKTTGNFDFNNYGIYGLINTYGAHSTSTWGNTIGVGSRINILESNNVSYKNIDIVEGINSSVYQYAANTFISRITGVNSTVNTNNANGTNVTELNGFYSDLRPLGANTNISNAHMFKGVLGAGVPTANLSNLYGIFIDNAVNNYLKGSLKLGSSGSAPVGINPSSITLELSENDSATLRLTSTDTTGDLNQLIGQIQFYGSDSTAPGAGVKSKIASYITPASGNGSYLVFSTSDGTTNDIDRLIINSNGFIGINTLDPESTLHVSGSAKITGITTVTNTSNSLSTSTGALQILGGVGIGGNLYVGGTINGNISGTLIGNAESVSTVETNVNTTHYITFVDSNNISSTAELIYTTSSFTVNPNTGNVNVGSILNVYSPNNSNSTITGAIQVVGGIGVGGNLYVGYTTSTQSIFNGKVGINTSTVNSRYTVQINPVTNDQNKVGLAVIGALSDYTNGIEFGQSATKAGGIYWINTDEQVRITTYNHFYPISFGNNWLYASTSSNVGIGTTVTNSKLTVNGTVGISGITTISNTTESISTQSGSLIVSGGVGIGGNLHVGGEIVAQKLTIEYTTVTTNLLQTDDVIKTSNTTTATSTTTGALIIAGGAGIGGNLYVGGEIVAQKLTIEYTTVTTTIIETDDIIKTYNTTNSISTTTGALIIGGGAGIAKDLYVGGSVYGNLSGSASLISTVAQNSTLTHFITFVNSNNTSSSAESLYTTSSLAIIPSTGNVGIGTLNPVYDLEVNGSFAAITKSFVIPHPTKEGKKLRYGSLEGPENGVYIRGKLENSNIIELPDYWIKLVDEDSITVSLTPIGKFQKLYVDKITNNKIFIKNESIFSKSINCFYVVYAERNDVEKLKIEI